MWRYKMLFLLGFLLVSCAKQSSSLAPSDSPDVAISQVDGPLAGLSDAIDARQPGTGPLLVAADQQFDPISGQTTPNPISVYVTATDDRGINTVELSLGDQSMGNYVAETDTQAFKNPFIFPSRRSGLTSVPIPGAPSGLVGSVLRAQTVNRDGTPSEEAVLELQADGSRPLITFSATSDDSPFTTESLVTLTGQTSDPETGVVSFAAFLNGEAIEINPETPFSFDQVAEGLTAGTQTVRLVAINGVLVPNQAVFTFSVVEPPEEPGEGEGTQQPIVSLLAAPTTGAPPLAVSFTASASDPDGDEVTYLYDFGDGVTTAGAPAASHTYTEAGTYTATVTVNDGKGGTASSSATITVGDGGDGGGGNGGDNESPTVTVEGEPTRTASPGTSLPLAATATDPDGDTLTFSWTSQPSTGVIFSTPTAATTNVTFANEGTYAVTLAVSDGNGGQASDEITVTVGGGGGGDNQNPSVSITGEASRSVAPGTATSLTATATDPDDDTLTYSWTAQPSTGVTFSAPTQNTTDVTFADEGSYTVTLTVGDGNGGQGTDSVSFIVGNDDNGGVDAVDDSATTTAAQPVTINVLANDKPSLEALVIVAATSPEQGGTVEISRDSKTIVYTPKAGFTGSDRFSYTVRDEDNNKATAVVTVEVE